jgi:predicted permease
MPKLLRRLTYLVRQRRLEAELAEEMEAHRAMQQDDLEARGITPALARQASRRTLGNDTLAREDARAVWVPPSLESVWQDTRYAVRSLRRHPGFAVIAVGTLALAVGLNTSLFTVFGALALRPWPVAEPARVVRGLSGEGAGNFSSAAIEHFAAHARTFEGIFGARTAGNNVLGSDDARVSWVSGDYFRVLRPALALGRPFTVIDDTPNAPPVAVLSDGYWRRRFASDPSVIGQTIEIEAVAVTVVAVASRGFTGTSPDRTDLWMPLSSAATFRPTERWVRDEVQHRKPGLSGSLMLAGRLAPGVSRQEAEAELTLLAAQLPSASKSPARVRLEDTTFFAGPKGAGTSEYPQMLGATLLVLLLACANVGNLLLARGAARRREVAVRLSLGASRGRIIRQLLTESLVLALGGGLLGLAMATVLPRPLVELINDRPTALQLQPDTVVLAFAFGLSVCSAILFGLAPALHVTRTSVSDSLKDAPPLRGRVFSLRAILLTTQVAFSVVLLVSAALLLRGVAHARGMDHGFDIDAVTVVSFDVPRSSYDAARTAQFSRQLGDALSDDGELTALTQAVPLGSGTIKGSFRLSRAADATEQSNSVYDISPRYFDVVGVPLVAGRSLRADDLPGNSVVVNETLARLIGLPASVIGRRIHVPADNGWNAPGDPEIVGVVRDAHTSEFLAHYPTLFQPYSGRAVPIVLTRPRASDPTRASAGQARTSSDTAVQRIGAIVSRIDPRVRLRTAPLTSMVDARLRSTRTFAILASSVSLLALVLATVGMFGVFAFWVQQRTREIGIRIALGATRRQIIRVVLRSSTMAIAAGLLLGCGGAVAASSMLRHSLFGLSPLDPAAYVATLMLLGVGGTIATAVPARRATGVDPLTVLRHD